MSKNVSKAKQITEKIKYSRFDEDCGKIYAESSLSRVWSKIKDFDCALISAFRSVKNANYPEAGRNIMTKAENKARSNQLLKELHLLGYEVTKVKGQYDEIIDGERRRSNEDSYFVVNANNDPKFLSRIEHLGKRYDQDSVCLIPKGENAYLFGTNKTADFPGWNVRHNLGNTNYGKVTGVYFSRVGGRTFEFVSISENANIYQQPVSGSLMAEAYRKQVLNKLIAELDRN